MTCPQSTIPTDERRAAKRYQDIEWKQWKKRRLPYDPKKPDPHQRRQRKPDSLPLFEYIEEKDRKERLDRPFDDPLPF